MSSFLERSISGLIYVVLFTSAILFSKESYILLTSLFGFVCLWEFSKILKVRSIFPYFIFIIFIVLAFYRLETFDVIPMMLTLAIISSIQLMLYLFTKKENYPVTMVQKVDINIRYLAFSLGFLIILPIKNTDYHEIIVLSLVLFIWSNDSFAYLIGKNFGKRKLFVSVSPKKTVEGFIGGVVFTVFTAIAISFYSDVFSLQSWIALSIITSILGTIGDLVESKFKRQAGVKDSGNIMPGHGGLLDRLDSLLFVAPFVYLYIHYLI